MSNKQITPRESSKIEQICGVPVRKTPETKRARRYGLLIILIFVGGFLLWSTLAPLESAAQAPGKIISAGHRRVVQHLDGGIISHIYIDDGSRVKQGEILVQLDADHARLTVHLLENQVDELSANQARLIAERDDDDVITFPKRLIKKQHEKEIGNILKNQVSLFTANRNTFHNQLKIFEQRISQLHFEIKGTQEQLKSNKRQYELISREIKEVNALYKKRLIELSRLLSLQREQARLAGNRGEQIAALAKLQQKIGETKHEVITLKSRRRKEILEELLETHQKLVDGLNREKTAEGVLARTSIRSPQDGVVGLRVHTIGGVIKAGEPILDIVPSKDELIIEARVSPVDIDVVHKGLLAKVELTAFKSRNSPTLLGKVVYVSADAFTDEQDDVSYYLARITIDKKQLGRLEPGQVLYPGMPVTVMIVTGRQTFWKYLTGPIQSSFNRAFREK